MLKLGFVLALELGDDPLGQDLAKLDAPLVERVDVPDRALGEDAVLVERDQRPEDLGREAFGQEDVRRPVSLERAVRHQPVGRSLGLDLLGRLAESQGLGLGKHVGHQQVVMVAQGIERLGKPDQVAGDQPRPLVDELVERMLAVGPRLAPVDGAGRIRHPAPSSVTDLPLLSIVNCCK